MRKNASMLIFSAIFFMFSCSGGQHENAATEGLSMQDKMYFEQYMVQGRVLYGQHCANCHQEDGTGLGRLIPPLAQTDYMLNHPDRTACVIKNGLEGEIGVNGIIYNQPMPANEGLTAIEIAQIMTFISNSWGNEKGYISVKQVDAYLESCRK